MPSDSPRLDNRIEALLAESLALYGHEIDAIRQWARVRMDLTFFFPCGMYDWMEAQVLYLLIRATKPKVVVEISPSYGYTTGFILSAMNKNDCGRLYSFDLEEEFHQRALRNFAQVPTDPSRYEFILGDVQKTYDRVLSDREVEVLFMDSDHSYGFAKWYIANLYPRVAQGGLISAHDVTKGGSPPCLDGDWGEGRAIWEFIQEQQIPETDFLYLSDFAKDQSNKPKIFSQLERYPFDETGLGTDGVEKSYSLWMVKEF